MSSFGSSCVNADSRRRSSSLLTRDDRILFFVGLPLGKGIIESVASIGHAELKKHGVFVVPGLIRMLVIKKPATKERKGINPFTKEPTVFKAKPARKVIKGRPVKAAKDAVA